MLQTLSTQTKQNLLWQTLDNIPSLKAVEFEWRKLLKSNYDFAKNFMSPCQRLAESVPCPKSDYLHHRVVQHSPSDIVGICDGYCGTSTLQKKDIVVYRFDVVKLLKEFQNTMNINGEISLHKELPHTWRLGNYSSQAFQYRIYFSIPHGRGDFSEIARHLLFENTQSFTLITPIKESWMAYEEILQQKSHFLVCAEEYLEWTDNGFRCKQLLSQIIDQASEGDWRQDTLEITEEKSPYGYWVIVNGHRVDLPMGSFYLLLYLIKSMREGKAFVSLEELAQEDVVIDAIGGKEHSSISELRKRLKDKVNSGKAIIQSKNKEVTIKFLLSNITIADCRLEILMQVVKSEAIFERASRKRKALCR